MWLINTKVCEINQVKWINASFYGRREGRESLVWCSFFFRSSSHQTGCNSADMLSVVAPWCWAMSDRCSISRNDLCFGLKQTCHVEQHMILHYCCGGQCYFALQLRAEANGSCCWSHRVGTSSSSPQSSQSSRGKLPHHSHCCTAPLHHIIGGSRGVCRIGVCGRLHFDTSPFSAL